MQRTKSIVPDVDVSSIKDHFTQREHAIQREHMTVLAGLTRRLEEKEGLSGELDGLRNEVEVLKKEFDTIRADGKGSNATVGKIQAIQGRIRDLERKRGGGETGDFGGEMPLSMEELGGDE
jgi:predicted RNase H-like nuclease (RuvC/YqgF family)